MYLRLTDMVLLMYVLESFKEVVLDNKPFQKRVKLSKTIVSCDFVHGFYSEFLEKILLDEIVFLDNLPL